MFHNNPNLRLLVLIAATIVTFAVFATDFGGSLGRQYGLKAAFIGLVIAILAMMMLVKRPGKGASENDRISYLIQVAIAVLVLAGSATALVAAVSNYSELHIMRIVPRLVYVTTVVSLSLYLQWLIRRDDRRGKSVFEWHLVLAGLAIPLLGTGMYAMMTTLFAHVFGS